MNNTGTGTTFFPTSSTNASEWTVILGRLKQSGSNPFEEKLTVSNISLSNLSGSNVAVLHLGATPTLSDYIQPICVGSGRTFDVGSACWSAGWSPGRGGGGSSEPVVSVVYRSRLTGSPLSDFRWTSSAGVPDVGGGLRERFHIRQHLYWRFSTGAGKCIFIRPHPAHEEANS